MSFLLSDGPHDATRHRDALVLLMKAISVLLRSVKDLCESTPELSYRLQVNRILEGGH